MKQQVKISKVKGNPSNPRIIKNDKFKKLVKSIQEFPEMLKLRPIVVDEDFMVLGGNMRLKASKDAGLSEVWIDIAEGLTEEQKKEFIVKDNVGFGEWEWDILANEWDSVQLAEWGLDVWENLDDKEPEAGLIEDDEIPEVKESIVKRGDIWQLGEHRIMCGDSTSSDDVAKLMNGEKADMVFTDPPYGVSYQSNMRTKSQKFDVLENDDTFITEWINNLPLYSNGFVFVWTSWKVLKQWIEFCEGIGDLSNIIVWDKGGGGIGDLKKTFLTDYEVALVYHRGAEIIGKRLGSVWSVGKDSASSYLHPTQKPVELAVVAIENILQRNKIVLDLFLGSGSTLIAAEKLKRKCYGMELDEKYCDVIINRWEQFTGLKATIINGTK
jgi:DNA modification methylase|tara:strand:- start:206 stop:1354 length:1149 start_codon:yes stop_codon:yes gene_type:complete